MTRYHITWRVALLSCVVCGVGAYVLARRLRDVGAVGVLLLAPAVLVMIPYQLVQREMGLKRGLEDWATNGGQKRAGDLTRIRVDRAGRISYKVTYTSRAARSSSPGVSRASARAGCST
jgi:hypothetical protein